MHARLSVGPVVRQRRKDDAGGSEHDRDGAGRHDPDAERGRGLVARPGDLSRFVGDRQPRERDLERRAHFLRPAAVRDVEEQRSRGIGDVDRLLSSQAEAHVVLRQQHVTDLRVHLGLVPPQPEKLRRREAGQRTIPRQLDQPLEPDDCFDLGALSSRALVVPEDRRPEDAPVCAQNDEAMHLSRQSDRAGGKARQAGLRGTPPVLGVLLSPAWTRRRERIALGRGPEHCSVGRERDGLDAGGADVEPDECRGHAPSAA